MTSTELMRKFCELAKTPLPLPGRGETVSRHRMLMELGREDLSLARIAEAHWDAVAILAEAGREPEAGAVYGVWASERAGRELRLELEGDDGYLTGTKLFLSGAGLVDRALITAGTNSMLIDVGLRANRDRIHFDGSGWKTNAFAATCTAAGHFDRARFSAADVVGQHGWYTERVGFWHGACGPAACWAGGALGLLADARRQTRDDAQTFAQTGAIEADAWAVQAYLDMAGREIDGGRDDAQTARSRALIVRHLVEQACTDVLRRVARAFGAGPLAMDAEFLRRCEELDLYLRQSHAERDLESLGRLTRETATS